ncbi:MAG: class I SAM-dependent methyltransferase [Planctomycetes bacterium]|nr:class I SAM-dependent methyltransferase [Planctomycetota bacterium]
MWDVHASPSHEVVTGLLERGERGRLLDIPSGGGPVVEAARRMGYDVYEVDLFPRPDLRGVQADACAPLPFRDASFDTLLSMEGIEHFEHQAGFLRECSRVLRPGGRMILTTPNVMHLSARLSAFMTGSRIAKQGFINEFQTLRSNEGGKLYHGHAFLIDAFRLRYLMRIVGLELERLEFCALSPSSAALAPICPALWLATHASLRAGRRRLERENRRRPPPEVERELARLALSPALLFGKKLVAVARREFER